jgi:putative sigma-54 modulation protein
MMTATSGLNIEYTARGTNLTPKLKKLAEEQLAAIDQKLGGAVSAHVILTEEKYRQIAEVTLTAKTEVLVATCEGTEMLVALHDALHKLEQQVIRHKERRMTVERQGKPASSAPLVEVASPPGLAS